MRYVYCETYNSLISYIKSISQNKKPESERFLFRVNEMYDKARLNIHVVGNQSSNLKRVIIFSLAPIPISVICETINTKHIWIKSAVYSLEISLENDKSFTEFIDAQILEFDSDEDAKLWFEIRSL